MVQCSGEKKEKLRFLGFALFFINTNTSCDQQKPIYGCLLSMSRDYRRLYNHGQRNIEVGDPRN